MNYDLPPPIKLLQTNEQKILGCLEQMEKLLAVIAANTRRHK
jgi:hypothetical protein